MSMKKDHEKKEGKNKRVKALARQFLRYRRVGLVEEERTEPEGD